MKKLLLLSALVLLFGACRSNDEEPVLYLQEQENIQVVQNYDYILEDNGPAVVAEYVEPRAEYVEMRNDLNPIMAYEVHISPEVYGSLARRTVNRMLDETAPLYDVNEDEIPTIYIRSVKVEDDLLPDGFFYANRMTKRLLENSKTFRIVNNKYDADYFLETEVDTVEFENSITPVIVYKIILLNQKNGVIKEWTENIRQVKNDDKSWW